MVPGEDQRKGYDNLDLVSTSAKLTLLTLLATPIINSLGPGMSPVLIPTDQLA